MKSKTTGIVLVLLAAAIVMVGATWALLSKVTEAKTNRFTFLGSDVINAELEEPHWDEEAAKKLVPGKEVPKDPQVTNTGEVAEYVALKLTFRTTGTGGTPEKLSEAQMAKLMSLISIMYDEAAGMNPKWHLADPSEEGELEQTWYYDMETALAVGATTEPLFDTIRVSKGITRAELNWLKGKADLPVTDGDPIPMLKNGFDIYIEGAGVYAEAGMTEQEAVNALYGLLNPAPAPTEEP